MPDYYAMPAPTDFSPERVISLVPSVTESLFDLNLGPRLVGITDYCTKPSEGVQTLPRVGGTKNPNLDQIIALRPDLVIMNDEENRLEDAVALQTAGIHVWSTGPRTVAEAINLLWEIMDVFDEPTMVPRIRHIEQVMDFVLLASKNAPTVRTFVPIWRDPWMTINQETYVHDLMAILGLSNVFGERERRYPLQADLGQAEPHPPEKIEGRDTRYPRVSLDEVVAQQPELIFLPTEPYLFEDEDAAIFYELDIPAAHYGTIYRIDGSLLMWHGTRLAYALNELPPIVDEVRTLLGKSDE